MMKRKAAPPSAHYGSDPEIDLVRSSMKNLSSAVKTALELDKHRINEQDETGFTALHWAACNRNTYIVDILLAYAADGLDFWIEDVKGLRAIDHAIKSGSDEIVKKLRVFMYPSLLDEE